MTEKKKKADAIDETKEPVLCPIAAFTTCRKCPFFSACFLKEVVGNYRPAADEKNKDESCADKKKSSKKAKNDVTSQLKKTMDDVTDTAKKNIKEAGEETKKALKECSSGKKKTGK